MRSIHSVRAGVGLERRLVHARTTPSNYLGTYTFSRASTAFQLGLPHSYTRRIGDPNINYFNLQAAGYIQDDIRVRKGLTITPGLRYEAQTHLDDFNAFGPRFGVTWAPFKNGKTTLRASAGVFTDWLPSSTYEQTLRVDGVRQQELNIANPSYPDPGNVGVVPPTNKYTARRRPADGEERARQHRRRLRAHRRSRGSASTYAHVSGTDLLRGNNLNTPVNGIRPDPTVGNLIEVARRRHVAPEHAERLLAGQPSRRRRWRPPKERWNWKRTQLRRVNYTLGEIRQRHRRRRSRCRRPAASPPSGGRRRTTSATASARSSAPAGSGTSTPT